MRSPVRGLFERSSSTATPPRDSDWGCSSASTLGPFVAPVLDALRGADGRLRIVLSSRCAQTAPSPLGTLRASGFLAPEADAATIVDTVREAALGRGGSATQVISTADALGALTAREREVLLALATGATNREIAAMLHVRSRQRHEAMRRDLPQARRPQ